MVNSPVISLGDVRLEHTYSTSSRCPVSCGRFWELAKINEIRVLPGFFAQIVHTDSLGCGAMVLSQ